MYDNLKYLQNFFIKSQKIFYNHLKSDNPRYASVCIAGFA